MEYIEDKEDAHSDTSTEGYLDLIRIHEEGQKKAESDRSGEEEMDVYCEEQINRLSKEEQRDPAEKEERDPEERQELSSNISFQNLDIDIRTALLKEKVSQLEEALESGPADLSATELNKIQLYVSSLTSLLSLLETLIERETDSTSGEIDPERLMTYLELHHRLQAILNEYGRYQESRFLEVDRRPSTTDETLLYGHRLGYESTKKKDVGPVEKYAEGVRVPGPHEEPELDVEETECPICYLDVVVPVNEERIGGWGDIHRLFRCHHTYCQECIYTYIKTAVMDGNIKEMKCPDNECGEKIPDDELEWICGPTLFAKYQKFLRLQELRADPATRWCPTLGCGNGVTKGEDEKQLQCPLCENYFCGECSLPWHGDESCKRAIKKNRKLKGSEKKGDKWIKKNSKPCPKCKIAITKQSGCNHMDCNNCHYEFCWVCLEEFKNYSHYSSGKCKGKMYYSNPVKKAAVYTGIGIGVAVAFCVVAPVALVVLPIYGLVSLVRHSS